MKTLLNQLFKNKNDMKNYNSQNLIDVRSELEFSMGSVAGSVNIPLDQLSNRLDEIKTKDNVVVFCQSGGRAGVAKSLLEKNGFTNVTNAGGWQSLKQTIEGKG